MDGVTVEIPLRVYPKKTKTILAVYQRIRGHYYIALALAAPSLSAIRWEPHIIIDRTGSLKEYGVSVISGPLVLLRYNNRDEILEIIREGGLRGNVHLPPWGFPALLLIEARQPSRGEEAFLSEAGVGAVKEIIKKLSNIIYIVEL